MQKLGFTSNQIHDAATLYRNTYNTVLIGGQIDPRFGLLRMPIGANFLFVLCRSNVHVLECSSNMY